MDSNLIDTIRQSLQTDLEEAIIDYEAAEKQWETLNSRVEVLKDRREQTLTEWDELALRIVELKRALKILEETPGEFLNGY